MIISLGTISGKQLSSNGPTVVINNRIGNNKATTGCANKRDIQICYDMLICYDIQICYCHRNRKRAAPLCDSSMCHFVVRSENARHMNPRLVVDKGRPKRLFAYRVTVTTTFRCKWV